MIVGVPREIKPDEKLVDSLELDSTEMVELLTVIEKKSIIGERVPKLDAARKVSGEARYIQDIEVPGMLHGKILRTDRVHARIMHIDTHAAKALPGVHAVITAEDTPGVALGVAKDNPPLKGDKVRCIRDEIAACAAETEEISLNAKPWSPSARKISA